MLATVVVGMFLVAWYLHKQGKAGSVFSWVGFEMLFLHPSIKKISTLSLQKKTQA